MQVAVPEWTTVATETGQECETPLKELAEPAVGSLSVCACVYEFVYAPEDGCALVAVCGYEFGYVSVVECVFVTVEVLVEWEPVCVLLIVNVHIFVIESVPEVAMVGLLVTACILGKHYVYVCFLGFVYVLVFVYEPVTVCVLGNESAHVTVIVPEMMYVLPTVYLRVPVEVLEDVSKQVPG